MTGIFENNQDEFWILYKEMLFDEDREKDLMFNVSNFDLDR